MKKLIKAFENTNSKNRLTRKQIMRLSGKKDKPSRVILKELRDNGMNICTDNGEGGYWLGTDQEYADFLRFHDSYPKTMLRDSRRWKQNLVDKNQVKLDV